MTNMLAGVSDLAEYETLAERMRADRLQVTVSVSSPRVHPPLWQVDLRLRGRRMRLPYYNSFTMEPPTPEDIMCDLITAAQSIDDADSIEEWANVPPGHKVGYRAEHRFHWYTEQTDRLRHLLGDRYDDYLWRTRL